jgi:DNA repair photolyase
MEFDKDEDYFKGRGAQVNTKNKFLKHEYVVEHIEGVDEPMLSNSKTEYLHENAKKVVNKVTSPDLPMMYSMNPYQGCEHGCIYCYARNTHAYYGYSAGLDFERKIIVKENAPELLAKQLENPNWVPHPIMFSGNTDCYQPVERKLKITRNMLKVLLEYRHPVGLITKNSLILRDLDILQDLNALGLVNCNITITTLNEELRRKLEPRTASGVKRMGVVKKLAEAGIPVNVMMAPIIPGLNSSEIPKLLKTAAENGALSAAFTIVRLNGDIGEIFTDWVHKSYPDRAEKVLHQIEDCHGGTLNDSRYGTRMRGEGKVAESIRSLFRISKQQYFKGRTMKKLRTDLFVQKSGRQLNMFD